jgi:hypothetical protein
MKSILMKILFFLLMLWTAVCSQPEVSQTAKLDTADAREAMSIRDDLSNRQEKMLKIHKGFAYTTGALLLCADGVGMYHFISMLREGHKYRDMLRAEGIRSRRTLQTEEIKNIWNEKQSQTERILHGGLIATATITYATTATIELSLPRISDDPAFLRKVQIHRDLFYIHAALMAANIGLGFAESYALSRGNHGAVVGLGITHIIAGFVTPIVIVSSGLAYR